VQLALKVILDLKDIEELILVLLEQPVQLVQLDCLVLLAPLEILGQLVQSVLLARKEPPVFLA
jgi:hypothetical protein